jgi:hypothetical protein
MEPSKHEFVSHKKPLSEGAVDLEAIIVEATDAVVL